MPFDNAFVRPSVLCSEHGIETMFAVRATRVDAAARFVELEDHRRVPFDALPIATGGGNGRILFPGGDLEGIYSLPTRQDADRIRAGDHPWSSSPSLSAWVHRLGSCGIAAADGLGRGRDRPGELFRVLGEAVGHLIEKKRQ